VPPGEPQWLKTKIAIGKRVSSVKAASGKAARNRAKGLDSSRIRAVQSSRATKGSKDTKIGNRAVAIARARVGRATNLVPIGIAD
jgi:hypothetical protein